MWGELTAFSTFSDFAQQLKGIPLPFTDLLNSLLMNMGLSGRGLEGRLASVQVMRQSGNQPNTRYPSNKMRWRIDSRCWAGGGLVVVSSPH